MKLLLDTHVALWAAAMHARLSPAALELLNEPRAVVYVSVASLWEIAIKNAIRGRVRKPIGFSAAEAMSAFDRANYAMLDVSPAHAVGVDRLPTLEHADPFDRMLVAQAQVENMRLVTADGALAAYGESVVVV